LDSEAHLIAGEVRTDANNLKDVMSKEGSVFLKYLDKDGKILVCLNLQQHPRGVYLGMFSVDPDQQGAGIGKQTFAGSGITYTYSWFACYLYVCNIPS
jgi:hypothetical protein